MALITFVPLVISAGASVFYGRYLPIVGIVGTVLCIVTVFCTAMIYASIRAVDAWHTRLTPAGYLLFAAAGGLLISAFFAAAGSQGHVLRLLIVIAFLILAWAVRIRWRRRAMARRPLSSPESATGLGPIGRVRPFEPPHMMENYLTREMGFRIARKHADKLFGLAILFGGALPTLLAVLLILTGATQGLAASIVLFLALASFGLGIFIERWLFFAEARHAVMNYYRG
jgi:DMSO reductase anchor subunit